MADNQPALAADVPERKRTEEPAEEPEPSHLNTFNSSGMFHDVSPDKLSVRYVGSGEHGHDVGAVQANWPAPIRRTVYYFEMKVVNAGQHGRIGIGFTPKGYDLRRQPGWDPNSCGYHGDDGHLYHGQGIEYHFGPTFMTGDTVGAGINYASQQFFFTKNGELVGNVVKDIKGLLFPTVALHSLNEEVMVNFGQQPFLFDIKALELEEPLSPPPAVPPTAPPWTPTGAPQQTQASTVRLDDDQLKAITELVLAGLRPDLIEISSIVQRELGGLRLELARLSDRVVVLEYQAKPEEHKDLSDLAMESARLKVKIEAEVSKIQTEI